MNLSPEIPAFYGTVLVSATICYLVLRLVRVLLGRGG